MATGTKTPNTTDEQDAAYNPGDAYYDSAFNQLAKREELADLEASAATPYRGKNGKHIDSHGDEVYDNFNADSPGPDDNIKAAKDQEEAGDDQSLYRNNESSGSQKKAGFAGAFSGKGATIAILGGLGTAGLIVGIIGSMLSSLLVNVKELFHNDQSRSARTNHVYHNAMYAAKMTKGNCTGKVPILCRFQSMSDRQIAKLERAGFKVETDGKKVLSNRNKITKITYPSGQEADTARKFHQLANESITNARSVRLGTNGRAAFYVNTKFYDVLDRFGLNKAAKINGKTKAEVDKDIDKNTNGSDTEGTNEERKAAAEKKATEEGEKHLNKSYDNFARRINKAGDKTSWAAMGAMAACGAYNMTHQAVAYSKKYHIDQMVKFSMLFMNSADRIKDGGDISPETASLLGDRLTEYNSAKTNSDGSSNDQYGLTATDSEAYRIAAHGDKSDLSESAQKFKAGGYSEEGKTSWLDELSDLVHGVERGASYLRPDTLASMSPLLNPVDFIASIATSGGNMAAALGNYFKRVSGNTTPKDGREALRYYCAIAPDVAMVAFIAVCGVAVAGLFGIVTTAPSVFTLGMCAFAAGCMTFAQQSCHDAMKWALEQLKEFSSKIGATEYLAGYLQSSAVGSYLQFTDVGNAWGAGNAFLASQTDSAYGLRPSKNFDEAKEFVVSTDKDLEMDTRIAIEDAKATPFDITNRYSFVGNLTRSLNLYYDKENPVYSSVASTLTLLPRILSYGQSANAIYSQPVQTPRERYDCDDRELIDIGIKDSDKFCNTVGITPPDELEAARKQANEENNLIEENIKYMTESQPANEADGGTLDDSFCGIGSCSSENKENSTQPSITEEGAPIPDSQYEKYLMFCTEQREDPWGTYSQDIQDASSTRDIDWWTGEQCLSDSKMMVNFRTYYNMCTQSATMDDTANCYSDDAPPTNSTCGDGSNASIYTCALQYDNYRYLWGGGHSGSAQDFIDKFKSGGFKEWEQILDCSGLVRMATFEATGVDTNLVAPSGYRNNRHWQKIAPQDAKQGDIVTLGTSDAEGHVVIVGSNDTANRTWNIFHAVTEYGAKEENITYGTLSYDGDGRPVDGVYRFVK